MLVPTFPKLGRSKRVAGTSCQGHGEACLNAYMVERLLTPASCASLGEEGREAVARLWLIEFVDVRSVEQIR